MSSLLEVIELEDATVKVFRGLYKLNVPTIYLTYEAADAPKWLPYIIDYEAIKYHLEKLGIGLEISVVLTDGEEAVAAESPATLYTLVFMYRDKKTMYIKASHILHYYFFTKPLALRREAVNMLRKKLSSLGIELDIWEDIRRKFVAGWQGEDSALQIERGPGLEAGVGKRAGRAAERPGTAERLDAVCARLRDSPRLLEIAEIIIKMWDVERGVVERLVADLLKA
jgi:hypothetical protein